MRPLLLAGLLVTLAEAVGHRPRDPRPSEGAPHEAEGREPTEAENSERRPPYLRNGGKADLDDLERPASEGAHGSRTPAEYAKHGATSALYRMLRLAMMARRALLLIDGIDEGGMARERIERHVAEVLARQGHVMLVTSRPAGLQKELFASFHKLALSGLTDEQQRQALHQRLGPAGAEALMPYLVDRMPIDEETSQRVTANPLMSTEAP